MDEIPGLAEWSEQFESLLKDQKITSFHLYNVNPNYFAFDENRVWVLDGGIQFKLAHGQSITYCWNKEMELMDMIIGEPDALFADLDYYEIGDVTEKVNQAFKDKIITNIDFEWNWYQKMNEDFELEEELNFAPLGLTLTFEDKSTLQLAAIQFAVNSTDKSLARANYLPEGDLLVSINEIIPIILQDDEPM